MIIGNGEYGDYRDDEFVCLLKNSFSYFSNFKSTVGACTDEYSYLSFFEGGRGYSAILKIF